MNQSTPVYHSTLTPLQFLKRSVQVYRDKTAVVYGEKRYSYAEFGRRVQGLAAGLLTTGLQRGDRVAFLCPNTPPLLEAHFGVPLAGGILVAINTRLAAEEVAYILNHSGASHLFVDAEYAEVICSIQGELQTVKQIVSIVDAPTDKPLPGIEYEVFLNHTTSTSPIEWTAGEDETVSINYTSGTTGRPKGVMYTHRGAYLNALGEIIEAGLSPDSVLLWTLPMFHCNGWCFTWAATASGATHVCLRKADPAVVWRLVEEERVSHFNGAPILMIALLNHPDRPRRLNHALTVTVAGAPPSPTLIAQMHELGAQVNHVYGLTETYGPYTVCAPQAQWEALSSDEQARRRARQGVNYVVADRVRIVDEAMHDVPADGMTSGEVVMHGYNVMKGYYRNPEATDEAFRGGWFHSGDLAVMHPDGYIELRDRSKDVIITGGENVSSIEVEQVLYRHEAVQEVAVIAAPHEKWGETPKAFVTLRNGHAVTEQELIHFCRQHIAHYKCPTAVEFTVLPKTSTGKIQKYVLREKEWAGRTKRIQGA